MLAESLLRVCLLYLSAAVSLVSCWTSGERHTTSVMIMHTTIFVHSKCMYMCFSNIRVHTARTCYSFSVTFTFQYMVCFFEFIIFGRNNAKRANKPLSHNNKSGGFNALSHTQLLTPVDHDQHYIFLMLTTVHPKINTIRCFLYCVCSTFVE